MHGSNDRERSPDPVGERVLAGGALATQALGGPLRLWDLAALRARLAALGLGW